MLYSFIFIYIIISIGSLIIWAFTRFMGFSKKPYYYALLISTFVILPVFLLIFGYYTYIKRGINFKLFIFISIFISPLFLFVLGAVFCYLDEQRALDRKTGDLYTYIKNERLQGGEAILK